MTAHKHAEMIKIKVANMEFPVFLNIGEKWIEYTLDAMIANEDIDFFMCLPQHKVPCLHWLNGGDIEAYFEDKGYLIEASDRECGYPDNIFMNDKFNFRIKPHKEKRYIAVIDGKMLQSNILFKDLTEAKRVAPAANSYQEIEIEV